ncbi:uncharacterized protein YALI1_B08575g [Yarrowia lipolytica]|uniref:Uncharacterized protein n=1 Tax=Yarrowia lipolytica TaxID=4952 RepID=A0A1D8N6P8_YARLL|nr:hypothetical protein YALI1_B08575g [Yarrowia lipolytica]
MGSDVQLEGGRVTSRHPYKEGGSHQSDALLYNQLCPVGLSMNLETRCHLGVEPSGSSSTNEPHKITRPLEPRLLSDYQSLGTTSKGKGCWIDDPGGL